jgi:hypothetical protein
MDVKIDPYTRLNRLLEDELIATAVEGQSQLIGHKIWRVGAWIK